VKSNHEWRGMIQICVDLPVTATFFPFTMFRNQYDTDVTVWSPEGRLLQVRAKEEYWLLSEPDATNSSPPSFFWQVEYAMESVKQGSACVGIRSDTHCVLGALKRSVSELSSHQKKLLKIDDHMGAGIAGLTADARSLAKYMQSECLHHRYVYGQDMPPHQLMADLADKHQRTTQIYVRRPFGVGMLIAAVHRGVPHLFQTCPSGNMYEFYANVFGKAPK
jgi:20S proteasome subunit alpha 6